MSAPFSTDNAGFKALFDNASVGIIVTGIGGLIEMVNPHAARLFDYDADDLAGKTLEILIPEDLRDKHVAFRESYFEHPKSRPMGLGMELFARKRDGSVFPVEISLAYFELEGGRKAMAFINDITQRHRAEHALKKANEELEQRVRERTLELTEALSREKEMNDLKSRFVSMASHEFRTPLSAILSSVSLIERYATPELEEKRKKHIERIKSSVKNLTEILNDFLSLDRLEHGDVAAESGEFNIADFSNDVVDEVSGMLKHEQKIIYRHSGEKTVVQDKKILRNVYLNLLSNAIKYSPEGSEIRVESAVDGNNISISFSDQGIGIPPEEQKHLFRKFFRAKNAETIQGTGLGLNIVHRYIELMKGNITFKSEYGKGSTFFVNIPANVS